MMPGTSFDRKTLTPFGNKLDLELRTLHEDVSYDHEKCSPVIVSDFDGNESDSSRLTDDLSDDEDIDETEEEYP